MWRRMLAAVMIMAGSPVAAQVTARPEVMVGAFQPGFIGEADKALKPSIFDRLAGQKLYGDQANRVEQHTLALKRAQRRIAELEEQLGNDEKTLTRTKKAVDDLAAQVIKA